MLDHDVCFWAQAAAKEGKEVVVVGGGIGGLVTAAKLAKAGLRVTLCEQGPKLGGRCTSQVRIARALPRYRPKHTM